MITDIQSAQHGVEQAYQIKWPGECTISNMIHLSGVSALQIEEAMMTQCPRIRNVTCVSCKYAEAASEDGHGLCVSNQRVTHVKTPLRFGPNL